VLGEFKFPPKEKAKTQFGVFNGAKGATPNFWGAPGGLKPSISQGEKNYFLFIFYTHNFNFGSFFKNPGG